MRGPVRYGCKSRDIFRSETVLRPRQPVDFAARADCVVRHVQPDHPRRSIEQRRPRQDFWSAFSKAGPGPSCPSALSCPRACEHNPRHGLRPNAAPSPQIEMNGDRFFLEPVRLGSCNARINFHAQAMQLAPRLRERTSVAHGGHLIEIGNVLSAINRPTRCLIEELPDPKT